MDTTDSQKPLPGKVAILYSDAKREYFPTNDQYITEKSAKHDAQIIATHIEKLGIACTLIPGNDNLIEAIKASKPDMVFNLVDSVKGSEYLASSIPGIMEMLDVYYTGAGILGLALSYNKFLTKKLLQQNGVPVPAYQLFNTHTDPIDPSLRFPLISKLNEVHGAVEITKDSISENEKHLRERLKFLIATYNQPVLVEEFIVGREVTAMLLEGLGKVKIYMAEKVFTDPNQGFAFNSFEDQWLSDVDAFAYQKFEDPNLKNYVRKAFYISKMADYGKFDVRIDSSGRYYFIDSNSNPAFGPKELSVALSTILDLYGINFSQILKRIMQNTLAT